jgi:hypothetical protein
MKFDIIRNIEVAQNVAQIIRDQMWRARSTGLDVDTAYIETLSAQIDELLFKAIINLKKKEKDNA